MVTITRKTLHLEWLRANGLTTRVVRSTEAAEISGYDSVGEIYCGRKEEGRREGAGEEEGKGRKRKGRGREEAVVKTRQIIVREYIVKIVF